MNTTLILSVSKRFLKAFIAGATASLTVATIQNVGSWTNLGTALANLGFAATLGGIGGLILAVQKWASWTE